MAPSLQQPFPTRGDAGAPPPSVLLAGPDASVREVRGPIVDRLARELRKALDTGEGNEMLATAMRLALTGGTQDSRTGAAGPRGVSPLPNWRLKRVSRHIEQNLAEPIMLQDLATVAGLSRMHFAAQFRAATGLQPHDYVRRHRIERAKMLLAETSDRLVDVALSVGFQTQAHFSTVFRQTTGETPRRWRAQHRRLI